MLVVDEKKEETAPGMILCALPATVANFNLKSPQAIKGKGSWRMKMIKRRSSMQMSRVLSQLKRRTKKRTKKKRIKKMKRMRSGNTLKKM
jgi:hypothetical protein